MDVCSPELVSLARIHWECPDECKEAVSSLMYAASRFGDLPELQELRSMFSKRDGSSLESFLNKEELILIPD
ncbi:hypothetical protein L1987_70566 [Smallanthus sonchifolius]|uniref:Uncharacterized protein n=1 Tax=Smallanthus sonchifolius TaxID=185202 RepID=A0ACB9AQ83_9ASTR|nr:hypothetical protein L1987_70566 [Smallanthus sonchifolius]